MTEEVLEATPTPTTTDSTIDCLLCASVTDCTKFRLGSESEDPTIMPRWVHGFCSLLMIKDESMKSKVYHAVYCIDCRRKIESIVKIQPLIESMQEKLQEMRGKIEDNLYLSNFQNSEGADGAPNQGKLRSDLIEVVETSKKMAAEPKTVDREVMTEPVVVQTEEEVRASSSRRDHQAFGFANNGQRVELKIRVKDNYIAQGLIKSLSNPSNVNGYKQVVVQGNMDGSLAEQKFMIDLEEEDAGINGNGGPSPTGGTGKQRSRRPKKPEDDMLNCIMCEQKFATLAEKRAHWSTHKNGGLYKCVFCVAAYKSEALLRTHVLKDHKATTNTNESVLESIVTEVLGYQHLTPAPVVNDEKPQKRRRKSTPAPAALGKKPRGRPSTRKRKRSESLSVTEESEQESDLDLGEDEVEEPIESEGDWKPEEEEEEAPAPKKRGRKPKNGATATGARNKKIKAENDTPTSNPVIKVPSDKRIIGPTAEGGVGNIDVAAAIAATSGRSSGRLRSKYRQYFY